MSKIDLYNGIKTDLTGLTYIAEDGTTKQLKTIALWRNQIAREPEEIPFLYPAVFIEFLPSAFMESSSKAYQTVDMVVRLHICFESYKTEDVDVLNLTDAVYSALQLKTYGTWGVMKRRNEDQNFDHPNVQDFIQDYSVAQGKDYITDKRPATVAPVNVVTINSEYQD